MAVGMGWENEVGAGWVREMVLPGRSSPRESRGCRKMELASSAAPGRRGWSEKSPGSPCRVHLPTAAQLGRCRDRPHPGRAPAPTGMRTHRRGSATSLRTAQRSPGCSRRAPPFPPPALGPGFARSQPAQLRRRHEPGRSQPDAPRQRRSPGGARRRFLCPSRSSAADPAGCSPGWRLPTRCHTVGRDGAVPAALRAPKRFCLPKRRASSRSFAFPPPNWEEGPRAAPYLFRHEGLERAGSVRDGETAAPVPHPCPTVSRQTQSRGMLPVQHLVRSRICGPYPTRHLGADNPTTTGTSPHPPSPGWSRKERGGINKSFLTG